MVMTKPKVLVVDDEESMRIVISIILKDHGFQYDAVGGVDEAISALTKKSYDAVLVDLVMDNDWDAGMKVLRWVRENEPTLPVIMITAHGSVENAVEAMREGAVDYIQKPFRSNEEIPLRLKKAIESREVYRENEALRREKVLSKSFEELIGESPPMLKIKETIRRVAHLPSTVAIYGESGVGKELVAREIHRLSPRADRPFVAINCAAIPETLLESELFGYKKGAFTGANDDKEGLFVVAHGGTVFLDEIGEMSLNLQVRLLRVLDNNSVTPIGGTKDVKVDVRIISATNRNLEEMVAKEMFRKDLFFRLNVIPIYVPPLRERKEDVPLLVEHFLKIHSRRMGLPKPEFSPEVMELFMRYSWPGNVRELSNMVERILALAQGNRITFESVPEFIWRSFEVFVEDESGKTKGKSELARKGFNLEDYISDIERNLIEQALIQARYSHKRAAEILGMTPRSLRYRLQKYGMKSIGGEKEDEEERDS